MLNKFWAPNAVSAFGVFLVSLAERTQCGTTVRMHENESIYIPIGGPSVGESVQDSPGVDRGLDRQLFRRGRRA
jgi:hypothetical protein